MNYLITYTCYSEFDGVIDKGTVRAKNKLNGVDAQGSFEKHLKKKHALFGRLIVHSIQEEGEIDNIFGGSIESFLNGFKNTNLWNL